MPQFTRSKLPCARLVIILRVYIACVIIQGVCVRRAGRTPTTAVATAVYVRP